MKVHKTSVELISRMRVGRRGFLLQSSVLLATFAAPSLYGRTAVAKPRRTVYLQPLGAALKSEDVEFVVRSLSSFFDFEIVTLKRAELPKNAYYPPRKRYRAEKLLDFLAPRLPEAGFRILGLTTVDISTTKPPHEDWGILGLATIDGSACVLSSFRAARGAPSRLAAQHRLGKVAVHELGHTLGLEHCANVGCLMEDAQGKVSTTDREYDLCKSCRDTLLRAGFALATDREIPWPKP